MNKPNPIILLGSARNGTTMLSNIISDIPGVCSLQHELHWGFHESNMYKNYKFWGNFDTLDSYIHFLELYSSMDTFKITGLKKDYFYRKKIPKDFLDFYFQMMDDYAIKQGSRYWLTKIDLQYFLHEQEYNDFINRLNKRYTDIKFISIQRNTNDVLASYLKMDGKFKKSRSTMLGGFFSQVLGVIRMSFYYFEINKLIINNNGLSFQFENVIKNREGCLDKILKYLGIKNNNVLINEKFKRNSSFSSDKEKNANKDKKNYHINLLMYIFDRIPMVSKFMLILIEKLKPSGRKYPDYWRLKKEKYFCELFQAELEAESNRLKDILQERSKKKSG
jgi:hypothetical protein